MNVEPQVSTAKPANKKSILLMDANSGRRALRKKIMATYGVETVGACDLTEASSLWQRDRYDMVLIDIRRDYRGCVAWRNEIKKEDPHQVVAFLVGKPKYVEIETSARSYVAEEYGDEWGNSLRQAVRESCQLLPQRNGFVEVGWRIAAVKRMHGVSARAPESEQIADERFQPVSASNDMPDNPAPADLPTVEQTDNQNGRLRN